jgi:hypothetical protein
MSRQRRQPDSRAFVLLGVLVVVMLLSMIALSLLFRMRSEETAGSTGSGSEQAWAAAMSGVREAMRGIVRRCSHARVDIDLRSAASGTAFSTDDLHAHVRHRHPLRRDGPAAGPGGGREAPQIRGTILYLGFVFTLFDQKERSGLSSVARATDARRLRKRGAPDAPTRTVRRCLWRGTILDHRPKPPIVRQSLFQICRGRVRWSAGTVTLGGLRPARRGRGVGGEREIGRAHV